MSIHFVEKRYADGKRKTACGLKVKSANATGTYNLVTCKRCLDSMRKSYGTPRHKRR
jgi:hypothetical protein